VHEYNEEFYKELNAAGESSAAVVLPLVLALIPTASAVDIGCGTGIWARTLQRLGVRDIIAVDGNHVPRTALRIDPEYFVTHDISKPLDLGRNFDLAICVEVAEHLGPERANGLVKDLVRLASVILFSAATPKQGGVNHVNEQWQDYWIARFNSYGYTCWDALRPQIRYNPNVAWIYRQNLMLVLGPKHPSLSMVRSSYPELRIPEPGDVSFDYVARYIVEREDSAKDAIHRALKRRIQKYTRLGQ